MTSRREAPASRVARLPIVVSARPLATAGARRPESMARARDVDHEVIIFPDDVHESLIHSRWLCTFDRLEPFLDTFVLNAVR
jgi:hypothetical protein